MLSSIRQIVIMSRAGILGLRRRLAISAATAFSVALAVCVLVGFLSMAAGFEAVRMTCARRLTAMARPRHCA